MATKRRRGAAKRTYAKQEAVRKASAPGKRFVGETAAQSAHDKQRERNKVARMQRASRAARPAEAARTAGKKRASPRRTEVPTPPPEETTQPESGQSQAAFRTAEEDAALAGAEVEPLARPLATVSRLTPRDAAERLHQDEPEAGGGVAPDPWRELSADVPEERAGVRPAEAAPPLGWAMTDLVRSALGLARTVLSVPFRIALAVPRFALRAVLNAT